MSPNCPTARGSRRNRAVILRATPVPRATARTRSADRRAPTRRAESERSRRGNVTRPYCTLAVTVALAFRVNVHVFDLFPPLEHAPDQMASRPFEMLRVIDVPLANDAEPVLPTATLIPAGVEVTRSPLRPLAVTVSVAV